MDEYWNIFQQALTNDPSNIIFILAFVAIAVLAVSLLRATERANELKYSYEQLKKSFDEIEEQAKLIVKTDLELNKTQDELDRRLITLNTLQRISQLISTTLDKNEIFSRLQKVMVTDLGFEKILVLMRDQEDHFNCRIQSGFSEKQIDQIISNLENGILLLRSLMEGHIFSSLKAPEAKQEKIRDIFSTHYFILGPILSQDGVIGLIFVGNTEAGLDLTQGDQELISILANQIGQSLENAQLFEEVFLSRQGLESRIKDRTKELARALDEVSKISKAKSDFVSAVSHELRTPLTSIKGYASLLITGKMGDIPEPVKERLEKIDKHSDNLVKLIDDLLDISRIESGRMEMKFAPHNIKGIIESTKDLLAPQLKEKNIQLTLNIEESLPEIPLDQSQMERVFINLIGNALKFTPQKGNISVRAATHDQDTVLFEISDNGIGIKEEDLPFLFNEFYRVENEVNLSVKGTGLGLALVKRIITAHKGRIWVTSQVNKGTSFSFTLPVNPSNHSSQKP